jgi:hypothetical protein
MKVCSKNYCFENPSNSVAFSVSLLEPKPYFECDGSETKETFLTTISLEEEAKCLWTKHTPKRESEEKFYSWEKP